MEALKGKFTQTDYNRIQAELFALEMKKYLKLQTDDDERKIKEFKQMLDKKTFNI